MLRKTRGYLAREEQLPRVTGLNVNPHTIMDDLATEASARQPSLATDGSAVPTGAGAAALLRIPQTSGCIKLTAVLGSADPVESELFAGILGLTAYDLQGLPKTELSWCCDSEAVVRGSTLYLKSWQERGWRTLQDNPVRHLGLWKLFAVVNKAVHVAVQAPRGTRRMRDHRACDKASRWAAKKGTILLSSGAPRLIGRNAERDPSRAWLLLDLQKHLEDIRQGKDEKKAYSALKAELSAALSIVEHR